MQRKQKSNELDGAYSNTSMLDQQATQRAIAFRIGWYAHTFFLSISM
jgi:hypothetical protein